MIRNRFLTMVSGVALVLVMIPGAAAAANAADCKHGGWRDLVDDNGQPFANQGDCVRFASHGGTPQPAETLVAVAYSDVNGSNGYQAGSGDVLIAMVVDTDGNGPDAGDRVEFGRYPRDYAVSSTGAFGSGSQVVTDAQVVHDPGYQEQLRLEVSAGVVVLWSYEGGGQQGYADLAGDAQTHIQDSYFGSRGDNDFLRTDPGSPSAPSDQLDLIRVNSTDDEFIDVDIFID